MKHEYGERFAVRLTPQKARRVAGMYPLPKIGYEILIARTTFGNYIYLQNVSGQYWLASATCPRDKWEDVFGLKGFAA